MSSLETSLTYSVAGCSGHNGSHTAENILVDDPKDSNSRWTTSAFPSPLSEQWIMLRLDTPSLLHSISFGKHVKNNPCSTKEFRVLAGPSEDNMHVVLTGTMKNDVNTETFSVNRVDHDLVAFPTQVVKIVPLSVHGGTSYRASLWHIALGGDVDEDRVREISASYEEHCESKTLRYVLKFLRERQFSASYETLLAESSSEFEHPLVQTLYKQLTSGDFIAAEATLDATATAGLFASYLQQWPPRAVWTQLVGADSDGNVPPRRGGHAACADPAAALLYVHGGYDGAADLSDFWVYALRDDRWRRLSADTGAESGGPGARSCHRMVFDEKEGAIYLLGGITSQGLGEDEASHDRRGLDDMPPQTELYRYQTRGPNMGRWEHLASSEKPHPSATLFEHQMAMDSERQIIFVYGGRYGDLEGDCTYSGMFAYHIREKRWASLPPPAPKGPSMPIPSRFGHSMVFDPASRTLFIFGGRLGASESHSDVWVYDVDSHAVSRAVEHIAAAGGPTTDVQRAVIDPALGEIYLFCDLLHDNGNVELKSDTCWIYKYDPWRPTELGTFVPVQLPPMAADGPTATQPVPRIGHQVVFDAPTKSTYLSCGNAGVPKARDENAAVNTRLDDLWRLTLERPDVSEALRKAKFLVRARRFKEMCAGPSPVEALYYLQQDVASVVEMNNEAEAESLQNLLSHLLDVDPEVTVDLAGAATAEAKKDVFEGRMQVFRDILQFFPPDAKEPSRRLSDLVVRGG